MQRPAVLSETEPAQGSTMRSRSWRLEFLCRFDNDWGLKYFRTYTGAAAATLFFAVSGEGISTREERELISSL